MDEKRALPYILRGIRATRLVPAQDFEEFLFSSEYLSIPKGEIYPGVIRVGGEIYEGFTSGSFVSAFVLAGLGSGKSTLSELMACAAAHWLVCLPDPHRFFGLLPDKPIVIPVMGTTGRQVKNVVFAGIRSFIAGGPFFQKLEVEPRIEEVEGRTRHETLKLSATFIRYFYGEPRDIVSILAGNSAETYPIGMNVFFSVVDEISKFRDDQDKPQAKIIFETLDQRRTSRFAETPLPGMTLCIGTAGEKDGFVDREVRRAERDPLVYVHQGVTWEMKGRHRYGEKTFYFAKLDAGARGIVYETYDEKPVEPEGEVLLEIPDIPVEFRDAFRRDPVLALRDFASIPSHAAFPFDVRAEVIHSLANADRQHPLLPGTRTPIATFKGEPGVRYYIHVDLALNREGGDVAGFVMGHKIGTRRVKISMDREGGRGVLYEDRPLVFIDLMVRWEAERGGEIEFAAIREFIYELRERGFDVTGSCLDWDEWQNPKPDHIVGGVSFDGWQSVDSVQILGKQGILAQIFSVDKTSGPYETLRETIHDRRLDFYSLEVELSSGEKVPIFEHEYIRLESKVMPSKRIKVDHPYGGSKDIADGVAAVNARIHKDSARQMGGW